MIEEVANGLGQHKQDLPPATYIKYMKYDYIDWAQVGDKAVLDFIVGLTDAGVPSTRIDEDINLFVFATFVAFQPP